MVTEFGEVAKDVEPVLRCSRGFRSLEVTFRAGRFECRVVCRRDNGWSGGLEVQKRVKEWAAL